VNLRGVSEAAATEFLHDQSHSEAGL
jgi:hypothetical protein